MPWIPDGYAVYMNRTEQTSKILVGETITHTHPLARLPLA